MLSVEWHSLECHKKKLEIGAELNLLIIFTLIQILCQFKINNYLNKIRFFTGILR